MGWNSYDCDSLIWIIEKFLCDVAIVKKLFFGLNCC